MSLCRLSQLSGPSVCMGRRNCHERDSAKTQRHMQHERVVGLSWCRRPRAETSTPDRTAAICAARFCRKHRSFWHEHKMVQMSSKQISACVHSTRVSTCNCFTPACVRVERTIPFRTPSGILADPTSKHTDTTTISKDYGNVLGSRAAGAQQVSVKW